MTSQDFRVGRIKYPAMLSIILLLLTCHLHAFNLDDYYQTLYPQEYLSQFKPAKIQPYLGQAEWVCYSNVFILGVKGAVLTNKWGSRIKNPLIKTKLIGKGAGPQIAFNYERILIEKLKAKVSCSYGAFCFIPKKLSSMWSLEFKLEKECELFNAGLIFECLQYGNIPLDRFYGIIFKADSSF
jgi:hypothetical protein